MVAELWAATFLFESNDEAILTSAVPVLMMGKGNWG